MGYNVSLAQFGHILAHLDDKLEDAIVRGLQSAGQAMVGVVVEEIDTAQPYPAVDRGEMRNSVNAENVSDGAIVTINAPHAPFLEYGTRPHRPPVAPILEWVKRKGLATMFGPVRRTSGRGPGYASVGPGGGAEGPAQRVRRSGPIFNPRAQAAQRQADRAETSTAYAIVRKIELKGTAPRAPMLKAVGRMLPIIAREITSELERIPPG